MKIVTCISDLRNEGYRHLLQASCQRHGLELVPLFYRGDWTTYRIRDALLSLYLRRRPSEEIVMVTDGFDTMLLSNEEQIVAKFLKCRRPILFAASRQCEPCDALAEHFPDSLTERRFLNAGGFIGRAGVLSELLTRYEDTAITLEQGLNEERVQAVVASASSLAIGSDTHFAWSSQYFWSLALLRQPDLIALDYKAELFLTIDGQSASVQGVSELAGPIPALVGVADVSYVGEPLVADVSDGMSMPCHCHIQDADLLEQAIAASKSVATN